MPPPASLILAAALAATAAAQTTDVPGAVLGSSISYKDVSPTAATIHWTQPDLGAYQSAVLGYTIEVRQICEQDEIETVVRAVGFPQQPSDARDLRNSQIVTGNNHAAVLPTATIGLDSSGGSPLAGPYISASATYSYMDDDTAFPVVDTVGRPPITAYFTDGGQAGFGVYATAGSCSSSSWTALTGVYTPTSGQNHDGVCEDRCEATACASIDSGTDAEIMAACSGCYPRDSTEAGCFPGAGGYPTTPLTQHTVTGLTAGLYYVFRIKARNIFGEGAFGTEGYAVHTHTVPTAPLSLMAQTGQLATAIGTETVLTTKRTSGVTVVWAAPSNYGIGTDNCADGTPATAAELRCAAKSPVEILIECDLDGDGALSSTEKSLCPFVVDDCVDGSGDIITELCTTTGFGAGSPVLTYAVYLDGTAVGTTAAGTTELEINDLAAATTYAITVKATNVAGEGAVSATLTLNTPAVPAAPIAPNPTRVTDSTIELTFSQSKSAANAAAHSAITGYRVFAQSKDALSDTWVKAVRSSLTSDGEQMGATANTEAGVSYQSTAQTALAGIDATEWLEVTTALVSWASASPITVSYLQQSTEYRFKIAYTNEAGTSTPSAVSPVAKTLEKEIGSLRIYTGAPCVYNDPTTKVTFAASSTGSNVYYRWELVYLDNAGAGALNSDPTTGANDFDSDGAGNPTDAGDTPRVLSGSTIALPGGANCLSRDCSVMEYRLPLPGFDESVPNYDEMEIRVVAYNKRGILRESIKFGWKTLLAAYDTPIHDYQTIEYCGCTDPTDDNYWSLATYSLPTACSTNNLLGGTVGSTTELSTVIAGEFEYYQFQYDESTFDIQLILRVDAGAVDVYISTDGIADPSNPTSHISTLAKTGVSDYYVVNVDYADLSGHNSLYVSVRGAALTSALVSGTTYTFGSFGLLAHASKFRSTTGSSAVSRVLLENETPVTATVPSHHYQFYEFYYPHALNDIDVEIAASVDAETTPGAAVTVYASRTERYPGPQRATAGTTLVDASAGYWEGDSHTGTAIDGTDISLMYTLSPEEHRAPTDNVLYLAVFGAAAHAQGTAVPESKYTISAKVYRYRLESDLMDPATTNPAVLSEDRRYSVVTSDNFNYYEIPLTKSTYSVTVTMIVHYGSVRAYWSKSTLPTQDRNIGYDGVRAIDEASSSAVTFTIAVADLNLAAGYVYLGLLGKTADASYDLTVTLNQENNGDPPTKIYNCGTFVGASSACDVAAPMADLVAGWHFYAFHISRNANVDHSITERSGAGTATADLTTDPNTWGTDWTEDAVVTWVDDYSDELNLDVDIEINLPNGANVYASVTDPYPSVQRGCPRVGCVEIAVSASTDTAVLSNVATSDRTWVYIAIEASGAIDGSAIDITPSENTPAAASTDPSLTTGTCTNNCNDNGSCLQNAAGVFYCLCDDGWAGDACSSEAMTGGATAGNPLLWASLSTADTSYAGCTDLTLAGGGAWQDADGDSCAATFNSGSGECNAKGRPLNAGAEWVGTPTSRFGEAGSLGSGMTALEACCACGGGSNKYPEIPILTGLGSGSGCGGLSLHGLVSPVAGDTSAEANTYTTSCGGNANDAAYHIRLQPGETLDIGMDANSYDSRHETSWGGSCPGTNIVTCTDDPDTVRHEWTNDQTTVQTVFFVIDGSSTGAGAYDLSWAVTNGNGNAIASTSDLYTVLTEAHQLDCSVDNCSPRGTAGTVGYVSCATNAVTDTACTELVTAPMMTVTANMYDVPAYARVIAYVDGLPYPRLGTNSFTIVEAAAVASKDIKIYKLQPGQTHTLVLVLVADNGDTLSITQRSFDVTYSGGCYDASSGLTCGGNGACHQGVCVCFDGYFGQTCSSQVDHAAVVDYGSNFAAGVAYRVRRDALVYEKISQNRFVNTEQLEGTAQAVKRSDNALETIKSSIKAKLLSEIYQVDDPDTAGTNEASVLKKKLATLSQIDTDVAALYLKKERNTIKVRQAKQEAERLKTANLEAYLDHKRSLFAHQTEVQNDLAAAKKVVADNMATRTAQIAESFMEGRFIKNQLRTANGPRTKVADLKTQDCTTDQFYHTTCVDVDYEDALFQRTTATKDIDTKVEADTGAYVPRGI